VPVPDDLLTILSAHAELPHRTEWLFAAGGDDPPHQNTGGTAGAARSGPGSLRHFYASGLIAAGCDVVNVQRTLGYAKATTTLETYSHLWPSAEDRTRAAATSLTREVLSSGTGNPIRPLTWAFTR
jgi:integrase